MANRPFHQLDHRDNAGKLWLGVNYWSRTGGPLMWRNYDPEVIDEELSILARHGLNMTRSFFYWPDFMPESDRLDETLMAHYADFLDRHHHYGLTTIPTFIVGHMSGGNWDPQWRRGEDLYSDIWMVDRQAWFIKQTTQRFSSHSAVSGWLISNEMPIYGGQGDTRSISSWAGLVVQAVRAGGGHQPVSIGDGAWGIEVSGSDTGFSVRELARMTDFIGPHVYRMESDRTRQHHAAAFICELAALESRPVILEEFGCTSAFASDENAGHYYRQTLHNSLLAGASGWIAWNNTDYDHLPHQAPYSHHPYEMYFGITTSAGQPKAPLLEMQRFSRLLEHIDIRRCQRMETQAALVAPMHMETAYTSMNSAERPYIVECLRQGYIAAREADLAPGILREADGLNDNYQLYLLPSTKQLTAPGWLSLYRYAEQGATVYVSYSAGTLGHQRGPWYAEMDRFFGIRHQLRYGQNNPLPSQGPVTFTLSCDWGGLREGDVLQFTAAGNEHSRSFLPVQATDASVLARDAEGWPALLEHRVGKGRMVLCTYPLEHMAAWSPAVNPEATWQLYDALAEVAGIQRLVRVKSPDVQVDGLRHESGTRYVWFISQSERSLQVTPEVSDSYQLKTLEGDSSVTSLELAPYGVAVMALSEQR